MATCFLTRSVRMSKNLLLVYSNDWPPVRNAEVLQASKFPLIQDAAANYSCCLPSHAAACTKLLSVETIPSNQSVSILVETEKIRQWKCTAALC